MPEAGPARKTDGRQIPGCPGGDQPLLAGRMIFEPLPLEGAYRILPQPVSDDRGFFARRFSHNAFAERGLKVSFPQRSVSFNLRRGTLRGLHFQAHPDPETKLVRCVRGSAFDVILDLRRHSPTFGRWHAETLAARGRTILYVPAGFAHGFQTLEDETEMDYEITPDYVPGAARGVLWNDPALGIPWPVPSPVISARDLALPPLRGVPPL